MSTAPLPPSNSPDAFDKALELANKLADREIQNINRTFDRYVKFAGWALAALAVIVGFFGWKTASDIRAQVRDQVSQAMPDLVRDQVQKQFAPDNVKKIANDILSNEVHQEIESAVNTRVAAEIDKQLKPELERRVTIAVDQMRPQIANAVLKISSDALAKRLAPRTISPGQAAQFRAAMKRIGPVDIVVVATSRGPEVMDFAQDITNLLTELFGRNHARMEVVEGGLSGYGVHVTWDSVMKADDRYENVLKAVRILDPNTISDSLPKPCTAIGMEKGCYKIIVGTKTP